MEAEYQADRRERDSQRAWRIQLAFAIMATVLGAMIVAGSLRRHAPLSTAWLVLRFGVTVPGLLVSSYLSSRPWGKARLQLLLGFGAAISVGAFSTEWISEWTPAMSLRVLWLVPMMLLWATVMTLPMGPKAAVGATFGVLATAQWGIVAKVPNLGLLGITLTLLAYFLTGYCLVLVAHWRERDSRELFSHRYEHQRLAMELRRQNETLQGLIQQRNEFVAGVLHDLRSPLTGVLLSTELLRTDAALSPEVRRSVLDDIAGAATRVASFADRFLEQRSLERAAVKPALAAVALGPAVERAVAQARLRAGPKLQRIDFHSPALEQNVAADELLLDRALGNLLDNAVKYSPIGGAITVEVGAERGTPGCMRVSVTDLGPGLSAAEQARLFQPYSVLGKKPTGGESSTGLGLSLVKHCIEAMGGNVGCRSQPGHGATFWLTLRHA
jgi:signal transduction histidine kinase